MIKTFPDVLLRAHTGKDEPIGFNPCGRFVGLKERNGRSRPFLSLIDSPSSSPPTLPHAPSRTLTHPSPPSNNR